jgi:sulfite reductase alpha subunit-like flavoprotein
MRDFLVLPQYEYCAEDRLLHCVKSLADDTDTRIGTSVTDLSENVSVFSLDEHVESPHVLILYGSQTGNAESAARRLKRELRLTKPTMMCLNEAKGLKDLQKNKITHVLAVCSTFGNGNPPANATEFFDTEIVGNFPGKKFAILGLGSSIYPKFCQAGEGLEKLFLQNRFESITPLTKADEAAGADGTIADWIAMMKAIILPPNVERALRNSIGLELDDKPPIHKIEWLAKDKAENFIQPVLDSAITSLCVSNDELLENSDHRSIRKISFCTPTPYESGDHLSVMPQNSMAMVNRFLRCFETELVLQCSTDSIEYNHSEDLLTEIANRPFDILALEGSRSTKADVFFQTPTTLSHALKTTLDLSLGSKDVIDLLYLVKRLLDDKTEAITRDDRESLMNFQDMQRFLVVSQTIFDADSDNRTQAIDKFISS